MLAVFAVVAGLLLVPSTAAAISAVAGVTATPGNAQVQLAWTNPPDADFDHVNVYRATSRYGTPTLLGTVAAPGATYTDATAVNGTDYWYVLRAATAANVEAPDAVSGGVISSWYTSTAMTTLAGQKLDATINYPSSSAANPFGQATSFGVRWDGYVYVPTSETYTFYSLHDDSHWFYVDDVLIMTNTCCAERNAAITLSAGWHKLSVTMHQASGGWTEVVSWSTPTMPKAVIPATNLGIELRTQATPRNNTLAITAPNGGEVVTSAATNVTWAATGAADRYDLAYSLDGGVTWGGTIASNVPPAATSREWLLPPGVTETDVRVRIRALSAHGVVLASDTSNADFTIDTPPVAPVGNLAASAGDGSVALSWTNPTDPQFDHVEIYRASNEYDTGSLVHVTAGPMTSSWADATVVNGTEYWYRVRAVDVAGRTSPDITAGQANARWYDGDFGTFVGENTSSCLCDSFGNSDGPGPLTESPDYMDYDTFSGRYSGYMYVAEAGSYHFHAARRSGARIWVNGTLLLDQWYLNANWYATNSNSIALPAGWVDIRFEFAGWTGDNHVHFYYKKTTDASWIGFDGGTLGTEAMVSAVPHASVVTVTAPNGGETFGATRQETISWTTTGTEANAVDLWYSTDGGATFPYLIVRGQPLSGSYDWPIPDDVQSTQVRVRAVARTAPRRTIATDTSDADLAIDTVSAPPPPVTSIDVVPGDGQNFVSWTMPAPLGSTAYVRIYRADNEWEMPRLVHTTADAITTTWTDLGRTNGTRSWYYVRTVDAAGREQPSITAGRVRAAYYDGENFSSYRGIVEETYGFEGGRGFGNPDGPVVMEESPDWLDYDYWSARWSGYVQVPETTTYRIRVYRRNGARLWIDGRQVLDEWYQGTDNAYDTQWITVQMTAGWHHYRLDYDHGYGDAFIYFQTLRPSAWTWTDVPGTDLATERTASATPSDSVVTLGTPNGGEFFGNSRLEPISWTTTGITATSVDLWYSTDGGATYPFLITRGQAASGTYQWLVPTDLESSQVRVRAIATNASRQWLSIDESDADFQVSTGSVGRPEPVTSVATAPGDGEIQVSWTLPSPIGSVAKSRIYRATTAYDTPVFMHETADNLTTTWTDSSTTNGNRYWYYVRTVDASGRESASMLAGRLVAEYHDGENFTAFRARTIEEYGFENSRGYGSPDGPIMFDQAPDWMDYDYWSARWSGHLYVPADTTYRIRVYRRNGARLWIDDKQLLNEWYQGTDNAYDSAWMTVQLTAGWHPYRLEHAHGYGDAFIYFQTLHQGDWTWRDVDTSRIAIERHASTVPHATDVTVVAPNGGEAWRASRNETISWTTTGTDASSVDLWYSLDGGATWPYLITRGQPLTGTYEWRVPTDIASTQVRVRAMAVTSARETIDVDASDADLTIDTDSTPPDPATGVTATPGDGTIEVAWTLPSPIGAVDRVRVYRATTAYDVPTLVHETADNVTTSWTDASVTNGTRYWYYVRTVDAAGREGPRMQPGQVHAEYYDGESYSIFKARTLEPYGFENGRGWGNPDGPWVPDQSPDWLDPDYWSVRWSGHMYVPESTTYRIRVYRRNGARLWIDGKLLLNEAYGGTDNGYDSIWMTIQLREGWHPYRIEHNHGYGDAFFYVQTLRQADWNWRDIDTTRVAVEASATTTPHASEVTVTAPNGGESWMASRKETISWTTTGTDGSTVDLWYSTDGGATYPWLIARGKPLSGSHTWLVPTDVNSAQVRVRAVLVSGAREWLDTDASDANLTIDTDTTPPPNVTDVTARPGTGEVHVSWTMPAPLDGTDHVRIYRATSSWEVPDLVHETADATTTSWTDTGLVDGTRYWYYVRTVGTNGREGVRLATGRVDAAYWSGQNFDTFRYHTTETYGFEAGRSFGPTDFPLSPDYPGESPSGDYWSARWAGYMYAPESTTYRIRVYRRNGARLWIDGRLLLDEWYQGTDNGYDSTWMTIQLTEGWHPYRLEHVHGYGDGFLYFQTLHQGDWAWRDVTASRLAVEEGAAATPHLATVDVTSPDGGEVWGNTLDRTITWSTVGMPVGTTYRVRYSTDGGVSYGRIIAQGVTGTSLDWHPPEGISTTAARIRVEAVAPNGTVVTHADSAANFSIQTAALAPVTNVVAIPGWTQVQLSWTNPASASFDHVNIYRTTQPWQLGTKVATLAAPTTNWTDTAVSNGTRYWYVVRAANVADEETMAMRPGGLRGDYYAGADFQTFVGSQVDPTIDFNWGLGGPAAAGGPVDNFSVRWSGYIRADQDAFWTIDGNRPTRDGYRLWIDGQQLVNRWNAGDTDAGGAGYMQLQDGWHRITMEYHDTVGTAHTGLYHARSGLARRAVPSSELAIESQVDATPRDPNPPTPNPVGTVQAQSPTAIEWSMITATDTESGLHASPYSYDNGSTWVTGSTLQRTGLSPNTAYTQTLIARDASLNTTTPRVLTARTHAVAPSIVADRTTGTWLGPGAVAVTFSNTAVFGAGGVEYYRYAWTTNSAHTFDGTEPQWTSGNLVRTAPTSGLYYLHARSYNADHVAGGQQAYGPFWVDAEAPTPNAPTVSTNASLSSVDIEITGATDPHSGLHATPYSFDNGVTWQATATNNATGLAPNTSVTRTVRVRDALGNVTAPTVVTAATLPVDPGVTSVPAGGATWHPGGTTVNVTSTVAFGPGTLWGYRWRSTANAADGVLDTDTAWTSGTLPVTLTSTGSYYLRMRSYNSTGVGGNTATLGPFHIDATPPPGTVPTAPSPTASAPALTWSPVADADSGLSGYRVYRSTAAGALGSQIASVAAGTTTYTDPDTLVDDTTYWYTVQAVDNVANEQSVGNTQIAVTYSSSPPTGSSISIAGGAGAVADPAVTLTLASANAVQMQVSNAPDFSGATWEPFSATRGWTLASGADGSRSVYAKFRNAGGTVSAAVVDTIDLDTTAPTPSPPAVTAVVGSATSIAWTVQAVTDALVGLPAEPYSLDDGATWQAGTSVTATALSPNTTYTRTARTRDALGNTSAQGTASATTLPAAPVITSTPAPDPLSQPRGTTFTFTNDAGWGAGAVEYYRWAWTTSATHTFDGTEAIWNGGTMARQEFVAGTYYLHARAYNSADAAGQTLTLGPYHVAAAQNQTELTMNVAATQTISCSTTGFAGSFLPGVQQTADVDCAVTSSVAGWNLALHADAAPFFTDFTDIGATPAAWSAPAATDAVTGFTVTGTHALAAFSGGTLWRGFAGTTDIRIADDTATSAGDTITTKVRVELGASSPVAPGTRSQTITYTLNPGT